MGSGGVGAWRKRAFAAVGLAAAAASLLVSLSAPAEARRRHHHHHHQRSHHRAAHHHRHESSRGYNPPSAAMVVDVKTGRTLHAENENELRHPASVTKVMTLYVLFEQLERGRISLGTPLRISAHAAAQAPSKLGLEAGETIAVEDAIKALVTKSANDVAAAIAENLAGSEEAFAEHMTQKARALGMSRTVYRNASGLPDPEQVTTARDLTILARAIQDRFPRYYTYFQTRVFRYAGASHGNHNKLLGRVKGVDGIKTGYTRASGFNLMTNVKTDDRHIVAVVLGGRSGASRDRTVTALVHTYLPRAYAGARTSSMVAEGSPARPVVVASAAEGDGAAVATPAARPSRPVADRTPVRAAVASAAGASSTTTPSPLSRGSAVAAALPPAAQAFASAQRGKIDHRLPGLSETAAVRHEAPAPAAHPEAAAAPRREPARPAASAWVIQLGAVDDESEAKTLLQDAKSRSGRALAQASAFTEKVVRDGSTLYRARFSGFDEAEEAQQACRTLKRSGFNCFATRS